MSNRPTFGGAAEAERLRRIHQGEPQPNWDDEQYQRHERGEHVFNFTDDCYVCRYMRSYYRGLRGWL